MPLPKLTPPAPDDVQSFFFPLFWGVSQPDVFVQHLKAVAVRKSEIKEHEVAR